MGPVKLIERAAGTALHTARHPVSSVSYAAGLARGLVGAVLHGVTVTGHDEQAGEHAVPTQRAAESAPDPVGDTRSRTSATSGPPAPQRVMKPVPEPGDLPEPIVIEASDEQPGESFATEPKAVSRDSAHGGGDLRDAEVDDWEEEAQDGLDVTPDVDIETPVGTTGADVGHNPATAEADLQQPDTPELLDPSVAKAVRSETEILRSDAKEDAEQKLD